MVTKKSESKTQSFYFVPAPFVPVWEWSNDESRDEKWESFKSNVKTFKEQFEDLQKSSLDAAKEQWDIYFDYTSKMQQTFIDALPDEVPSIPGFPPIFMPVPPKAVLKKGKELREERNKHNKEQFDSEVDYAKKRRDHAEEAISEGVKNIEEKIKKKE